MQKKIIAVACAVILIATLFVSCKKDMGYMLGKDELGFEHAYVTDAEGNTVLDDNGNILKTFQSQSEAARWCLSMNLTKSTKANSDIAKRCKDGKKAFGYFWKYQNEGVETMPDECTAVG